MNAIRLHLMLAAFAVAGLTTAAWGRSNSNDDALEATQRALQAAAQKAAPCVVQIETIGGAEMIGGGGPNRGFRKGVGPTTGLIVSPDGDIVSSAFNFAQKPASIQVTVPGRRDRYVARIVATDQTRMITLLKIDATNLPTPVAAPKGDIRVGQWAVALGRALDASPDRPPAMSVGIVSALGRIWGKAIQTDAKISPANYGGPLVDIEGRVLGVLVPAAPRGESETAGVEWYDSGIGFAIPLEDVLAALPRLKKGQSLQRGLLGVTFKAPEQHAAPVIAAVAPDSAAARADLRTGDAIIAIDGRPVASVAQLQHALGPRYEGDSVRLRIRRGGEERDVDRVVLGGPVAARPTPYLGILTIRDDPEPGVAVRWVEPGSPADRAGIQAGDRIVKWGPADAKELRPFSGRDELRSAIDGLLVGMEIQIEVRRKTDSQVGTVKATLAPLSEMVPETLPVGGSAGRALEPRKPAAPPKAPADAPPKPPEAPAPPADAKPPATGLIERTTPAKDRSYWIYVPANYDPNVSHALVVWLHPAGLGGRDTADFIALWRDLCEERHIILVGPKSDSESGWLASEADFIQDCVRETLREYTIDRQRIVAHGMGVGGQMAYYLGFVGRDLFRGVAAVGATLNVTARDNVPRQRLAFFVVAGGKDPSAKEITEAQSVLREKRFPVTLRIVGALGREYLDRPTLEELARWIDSLDRF